MEVSSLHFRHRTLTFFAETLSEDFAIIKTYSLSASVCLTSCVSHHCEGSILPIFHLSSAYGPSQRPFSVTNFAIRGSTCPSSRLSPEIEGFCQQFVALSSPCGGSIPPTQLWSSNSSTLGLGGRFPPLHSSNCVSVCTSFLYIGSGCIYLWEQTTLSSGVLCPSLASIRCSAFLHLCRFTLQLACCRLTSA